MNYLLSLAMLFMTLAPQSQNFPEEFYNIPEHVRERATVVVIGTFGQGRTPCFFMPDGRRVWFIDSYFNVKQVYRGKVGSKFIRVNTAMLPDSQYVGKDLKWDQDYLVLLRPDKKAMKAIATKEGLYFRDSLRDEEIVAIVELK